MNRDYRAKTASRVPRTTRSGGGTILGIFIGLVLGLGIAAGVFYYISRTPSPFQNPNASNGGAKNSAPRSEGLTPGGATTTEKPRFDFYKILPGTEDKASPDRKGADTKTVEPRPPEAARAGEQKAGKQIDAKAPETKPSDQYFLQTGSFSSAADAENEKARLALSGFEAGIQSATLADKGQRHRVRLGPFTSVEEMNRNKAELAKRGIEATVIKNP